MNEFVTKFASALCVVISTVLAPSVEAQAQQPVPLKIIWSIAPNTLSLPQYVAQKEGYFDKAGLKIEDIYVLGDSNAMRGLISGGGDVAAAGLITIIQAIMEGARLKIVAAWQPKVDYQMLVRDKIGTFKDLATARIGTNSAGGTTQKIPEMLMQKYGVDKSKTSFIALGNPEARMKSVVADKVDASVVNMTYAATATREAKGVKVLSSIADDFPLLGYTFMIVRESDLADPVKRKALETYVRYGVIEGSRFIEQNPERAAVIMQERVPETDLGLIQEVVRNINKLKLWGSDGGLDKELIEYNVKLGIEMGILKRQLRPGEAIDTSLIEGALAAMGKK